MLETNCGASDTLFRSLRRLLYNREVPDGVSRFDVERSDPENYDVSLEPPEVVKRSLLTWHEKFMQR